MDTSLTTFKTHQSPLIRLFGSLMPIDQMAFLKSWVDARGSKESTPFESAGIVASVGNWIPRVFMFLFSELHPGFGLELAIISWILW